MAPTLSRVFDFAYRATTTVLVGSSVYLAGVCVLVYNDKRKQRVKDKEDLDRLGILPGTINREQLNEYLAMEARGEPVVPPPKPADE